MSTDSLLAHNMMAIRPGHAQPAVGFGPAARTKTVLLEGRKVIGERVVSHVDDAVWCDGVAEALHPFFLVLGRKNGLSVVRVRTYGGACRPDAVKHIRAQRDGDDEVFGVSLCG